MLSPSFRQMRTDSIARTVSLVNPVGIENGQMEGVHLCCKKQPKESVPFFQDTMLNLVPSENIEYKTLTSAA
jgi:hypothetical protein